MTSSLHKIVCNVEKCCEVMTSPHHRSGAVRPAAIIFTDYFIIARLPGELEGLQSVWERGAGGVT